MNPVSSSMGSNYFLRVLVEPVEASAHAPEPTMVARPPTEGWRRGAIRGEAIGHQVASALTLPFDLIAGTWTRSARSAIVAEQRRVPPEAHEAHKAFRSPLPDAALDLPLKTRFLLSLEDGLLGLATSYASVVGGSVGGAVGCLFGGVVGACAWALRGGAAAEEVPEDGERTLRGWDTGYRIGAVLLGSLIAVCALAVSLTSSIAKGVCMFVGATVGALIGMGADAQVLWNEAHEPKYKVPRSFASSPSLESF